MNVLLLLMLFCLFTSHLISANAKAHNKKRNQIVVVAKQETNATVDEVVVDIRSNHKAHNDGVAHGNSLKRTNNKNIEVKM
ncbi:hypothetical protein GPALN_005751 [Globodera pallida]|nr:hypothetical protein GPALN_005751 [Globodera pallida]